MGVESKIREMLAKGKEIESALNEETQELDEWMLLKILNLMQLVEIKVIQLKGTQTRIQKYKTLVELETSMVV